MRLIGNATAWSRARVLLAVAFAFCQAPAFAHDFWIEPATFSTVTGRSVELRLRVGEYFAGDPLPLNPARVRQFIVQQGRERKPVEGRAGADPAGSVTTNQAGLLVIGYHSHWNPVELPADKFNTYLMEEGLDSILALRARRNQTAAPAREVFSRCAKTLVRAQRVDAAMNAVANRAAMADQPLGFPLELVAERNPYALGANRSVPIRLNYEGRPLAGTLVVALNSLNPTNRQAARTDNEGRVRLRFDQGGTWLVKAVHMIEAPAGTGAEWASYWASLTFESVSVNAADTGRRLRESGKPAQTPFS